MAGESAGAAVTRDGRPGTVVSRRTGWRTVRSGLLWGVGFGLVVTSSAFSYASAYKTAAQRERLATLFGSNAGLAAINGRAHRIQTVPGYTVWKSFMFLVVVGSVWGLFTATRLLRGEEDAGRWELLLAGQTTPRRATAQVVGSLAAGLVALWAATAAVLVAVGRSSTLHISAPAALYFALALIASAVVFSAAGALASQLAPTRRQANAYAGVALGVFYALRLVADSGANLEWLRWATPLGWVEELQPLTGPRPTALVPIAVLVAGTTGLAVHLAGRRDLGASVFRDRVNRAARTRLLGRPIGLTVRLVRPTVLGWAFGIAAMSALMGLIAKQGGVAITSSPSVAKMIARLGGRGSGAELYLGFAFVIVAVMVAFVAAGLLTAARGEEAEGRLEHLLVRPVSRPQWFGGRLAVITAALVASGLLAGVCAWAAAASQQSGVGLRRLLEGGINTVPPVLCLLGIGALAMGLAPRRTSTVTYGVLMWSLFIDIVGGAFTSNHWLLDTSVFHHMAASPAVSPDWTSAAALVAVGLASGALGAVAFGRRDLAAE